MFFFLFRWSGFRFYVRKDLNIVPSVNVVTIKVGKLLEDCVIIHLIIPLSLVFVTHQFYSKLLKDVVFLDFTNDFLRGECGSLMFRDPDSVNQI